MARYRDNLPQLGNDIFACYTGMDTEIIYKRGIDLPGFASYPLLSTSEGKMYFARSLSENRHFGQKRGIFKKQTQLYN